MRGLYEYNYPSNKELSIFTGQQYFKIQVTLGQDFQYPTCGELGRVDR